MVTWTNLGRPFLDPTVVSKFPLHMWFALHIFSHATQPTITNIDRVKKSLKLVAQIISH